MKDNIKSLLYSICASAAIFINVSMFEAFNDMEINNISKFYNTNIFGISLVGILLFLLYKKVGKINITKFQSVLAIIFAFCMLIGECYVTEGTFFIIYQNFYSVIISALKIIGYTHLFRVGFNYLNIYIDKLKIKELKIKNKNINKFIKLFENHPFKVSFVCILIVWSIYFIAYYPIVLSPDPSWQIIQYFNIPNKYINWVIQLDPNVFMTTHHPVTQTYLIGWCIDFGRWLINDNFGLFCYTVVQSSIYISVFAYTIKYAKNNGVSNKLSLILLLMYMFVPMYGFYTVSAVKDVLYTSFMILFVLYLHRFIKNNEEEKIKIKDLILFTISMILMCLFRHNGVYVIILTAPFILILLKKNIFRIGGALVVLLVVLHLFNNVLVPSLGISKGSTREVLSVPFQQTARLVKYSPESISKKDRKVIDKILKYKTLADRYDPDLADPVKNKYNKETTNDDLKDYFKVWFKGLKKRPDIYIDATLNNTYGYYYPSHQSWYIYSNYNSRVVEEEVLDYHYNNLDGLRNFLSSFAKSFPYIPIVGLLSNIGFNTWMMFIIISLLLRKKEMKKYIVCMIPLVVSFLICIAGPANTYFRYTMPYIFVIPILSILFLSQSKGGSHEKK